jgi:hypothetical protein
MARKLEKDEVLLIETNNAKRLIRISIARFDFEEVVEQEIIATIQEDKNLATDIARLLELVLYVSDAKIMHVTREERIPSIIRHQLTIENAKTYQKLLEQQSCAIIEDV